MDRRQKEYRHQLNLLKKRIATLEKKGYTFDVEEITKGSEKNVYYATEYFKSLRGEKLQKVGTRKTQQNIDNEPDFVPPQDSDSPNIYSAINEIETLILEFPDMVVMQYDVGKHGKTGERDVTDVSYIGMALYDTWNNTVTQASSQNMLDELEDYYQSVEGQLANLLQPYGNLAQYFYESEVSNMLTQALRLLNWGVALSSEQMENFSPLYTNYENIQ